MKLEDYAFALFFGLMALLVIVAILRIPYCLYHSFTPMYEAPLICRN